MTHDLQELRRDIDEVDCALVALLARRMRIVDRVIAVKRQAGIPAALPERIEAVVEQACSLAAQHGVPERLVERLWRCLIDETIAYEEASLATTLKQPPSPTG